MAQDERNELSALRAQLAHLRRESARSAEMSANVIAAFGEAFRRERRARKAASKAVSLDRGGVMLPLGIKEETVAVAASSVARRVSATVLCRDSSQVVVVCLTFKESFAERVRALAGQTMEDPIATAASTFRVSLIAGESRPLFEIEANAGIIEFALRRVGGEQCAVQLQVEGFADAAGHCAEPARAMAPLAREQVSSKGALWKAQEMLRLGCAERAMEVALAYATDTELPALALLRATRSVDDAAWLANVNAYVEHLGIAPIRLESGTLPRFMRLAADAPSAVESGPLVSVIMPAFNAEKTLALAAGSILNQSWSELELIVVDDGSTDSTYEIARDIARADPRAKVLRNKANVGPYVSKNVALSWARGSYVTCHDADDWAHPQRLENQVATLQSTGARACVASWLRLNERGEFTGFTVMGRQSHDGALRLAHVTCMIDAEFMKRYVGYWDCVRFGADGEMLERLERILGRELARPRQLAVLSMDRPRSLTNDPVSGISKTSGLSEPRRAYRDAWRQWHATVTLDDAYVRFPQARRPFAAPEECLVSPAALERVTATH